MGGQGGEGGASCEGKHMGDESKERIMRVLDIVGKTKEVQTQIFKCRLQKRPPVFK